MGAGAQLPHLMEKLFPFACVVDSAGCLLAIGKQLERFVPATAIGSPLIDWFDIESPPELGTGLHHLDGALIAAVHRTTQLGFRGQVVSDIDPDTPEAVLLAWSPWITSMADFTTYDLTLADFAAHDATIDVLHLLQATQSAQRDAVAPLKRLERFFNLADDCLLVLNATGRIRQANETFRAGFAGPGTTVIGRNLMDFAVGEQRDALLATLLRAGDHDVSALRCDVDLRLADGGVRRFRLALVGDTDDPGSTRATSPTVRRSVYVIARDVTDEEAQHRATELVLDGAPIAMLVADQDGTITYANAAACRLFRYDMEHLIGSSVETLLPQDLRNVHVSQRRELMDMPNLPTTRVMGEARHVVGVTSTGESIELEVTLTFVSIRGDRHVVASALDVRAHKALERELREARDSAIALAEAKSSVLANTSHEIRTPLTSVLGLADLLLDTELNDDQRDMVVTMRTAGDRLLGLVNDVLTLARSESGRLTLDVEVFSPAELAHECLRVVAPQITGTQVDLVIDINSQTPTLVSGDREKLRGVLLNILGNAVKFTESGGIHLHLGRTTSGDLVFSVKDSGIGIDADTIPHLFEPFVQADNSTTRRFGGSGLGLSIADQLVRMMGGRITVTSTLGEGSCFTITLPMAAITSGTTDAPPSTPTAANLNAAADAVLPASQSTTPESMTSGAATPTDSAAQSILLVEDDRINSEILRRMLTKLGVSVVQAFDGISALEHLRDRSFDMVLMDCHMPGMDGLETTRRIRAGEAGCPAIRVVALTAAALDEDRRRCLDAGMDDYLTKPIRLDDIAEAIGKGAASPAARATPS